MVENLKVKYDFKENTIYCGNNSYTKKNDNKVYGVLTEFPSEKIDLIYIDPPFFSNKHYEIIWEDGYESQAYEDRWKGGLSHYISWMRPKIEQLYRVLKPNGSFYLHCDWHASHYLKVLCDEIFKNENYFRANIVWKRTIQVKNVKKNYSRNLDYILFYTILSH